MSLTADQQAAVDEVGADSSTAPDLDVAFVIVPVERALGEACARRLSTPEGSLPGDLGYGLDLRQYLGADLTDAQLAGLRADIEAQCLLDERVESLAVELDFTGGRLDVALEGTSAAGPFTYVLNVSSASVEQMKGG